MIGKNLSWINLNASSSGGTGGVSDYNDLANRPIVSLTGTSQNPLKLWNLSTGLYLLNGYVSYDTNNSKESVNLFVSVTAQIQNGKYVLSAFVPFWEGHYEYIKASSTSTEYTDTQVLVMLTQDDVLILDNEAEYTPTSDYHPSTKKYVDDKMQSVMEELARIGVNEADIKTLIAENRRRDIAIQALLSESADKEVTIEESTHTISLDYSMEDGMTTVNSITGNTLVNVSSQKDEIYITKSQASVKNSKEITTVSNGDGKALPTVEGDTLVNVVDVEYNGHICGVEVDFSTMTYIKLDDYDRWTISPFKDIKRCNLLDGVVQCYIGHENYIEDGTNGDVMVEIPKFYYKVVPLETEDNASGEGKQLVKAQWWISNIDNDGFKVHPAFVRNNVEVDYIYISAYEGSLYDVSEGINILDDSQVADFSTDMLCSIANAKPMSGLSQNLTITNAEKLCVNKGTNYLQYDFTMASMLQLLMLIEYNTFDIQSVLGNGVVSITDDSTSNCSINTGETSSINNLSGYNGTNGASSVSYHGIENPYGNIWKFVSGLNVYNYNNPKAYWSNNDKTVDTSDNHNEINFNLCTSNGYISRIGYDENNDFVFLPTKVDSSNNIKDYYYQNNTYNGWTIALLGGLWIYGSTAGAFCWGVHYGSSYRSRAIGCRLAFFM